MDQAVAVGRRIKAVQKKLRQISDLRSTLSVTGSLSAEQRSKLTTEPQLLMQLAQLQVCSAK